MRPEPTVFVIDDDQDVRHSLACLLATVGLRAECHASARAFLEIYTPERPGCLILDARMPDIDGLELQRILGERNAPLPIILVSGHGDVPLAVRAMRAGALDFFEKPFNAQLMLDRVREALAQSELLLTQKANFDDIRARRARLSGREVEVMDLLADGLSAKGIARHFGVSPKTVEGQRVRILAKMNAATSLDLVRLSLVARSHFDARAGVVLLHDLPHLPANSN